MELAYSDKRKNKKSGPKVKINLSSDMVDSMLEYCLSDSPLVNLRSLLNLKNLIDRITFDDDVYENRLKFELLKTILHNEVEKHLFQYPLLVAECIKKFPENEEYIRAVIEEAVLNVVGESDIEYINEYVEERLTYFYLYENKDKLRSALDSLDISTDLVEVNSSFETVITKLYKDLQNSKAVRKDSATDFCIGGSSSSKNKNLSSMVKKTIDDFNKPSNFIRTGVQAFNDMLGGGLENGRAYLIYAPPKSWKSGLLMNLGIWACKYNTFVPKDPEKTPCVLYVTMENTSKETINRLFTHITGQKINLYNYKNENEAYEEASKIIEETIVGDRNISFEIRYRKTKSISTTDLDSMIDELALEGKEVVLLIQDYMKRIRSSENNPDIRLEMGAITDDFCSIARSRDIPVVSAMQINRTGIGKIESALAASKGNIAKLLDKSDAGESALPLENADYVWAISPEEDQVTKEKYLGVKLWVSRIEEQPIKYFLQPFDNGMKLREDIFDDNPSYIDSLGGATVKDFNPSSVANKVKTGHIKGLNSRKPELEDGEINI